MKRFLALGLVALLLASAAGCGGGSGSGSGPVPNPKPAPAPPKEPGPDDQMKSVISAMNALSDAMEKMEPLEKIKAAAESVKASGEKLEKMNLSDAEKDRLLKTYEKELVEATMRMMGAAMANPDAGKYLDDAMGPSKKNP